MENNRLGSLQPKIIRALFVAGYRLGHACLSLQFDKFLHPAFDSTVIFTNVRTETVLEALYKYHIDLEKFIVVQDSDLVAQYPDIDSWNIPGDPRNGWLRQQAIKLSALDSLDADIVFIQDPDTFCVKPYQYWNGEKLNLMVIANETHAPGYYQIIKNTLDIDRQNADCFVTELHPVLKTHWAEAKNYIETKFSKSFLRAIIDNVPADSHNLKWFSEYEFLGNWTASKNNVNYCEQLRFEFECLEDFAKFSDHYNCVCHVGSDKDNFLFYNYYDSSARISEADYILSIVKNYTKDQ
jgi:hypothetical protein